MRSGDLDLETTVRRAATWAIVLGGVQAAAGVAVVGLTLSSNRAVAGLGVGLLGAFVVYLGVRERSPRLRTSRAFTVLMAIFGVSCALWVVDLGWALAAGGRPSGLLAGLLPLFAFLSSRRGRDALRHLESERRPYPSVSPAA